MVQEFRVVRCYSCKVYQVDQVKRSTNKWTCRVCHEKQSLKQFVFKGSGNDCRRTCQELNMKRMEDDMENRESIVYGDFESIFLTNSPPLHSTTSNSVDSALDEESVEKEKGQCFKITASKWNNFLNEIDVDDTAETKENDTNIKVCFRGEFKKSRKRKSNSNETPGKQKVKYNNGTGSDDWKARISFSKENLCTNEIAKDKIDCNFSGKLDKSPSVKINASKSGLSKWPRQVSPRILSKWSTFFEDDTDLIYGRLEIDQTKANDSLKDLTNDINFESRTSNVKKSKWESFLPIDSRSEFE